MHFLALKLPTKRVAALIGRSIYTLQAARRGDAGVNMPPHRSSGHDVHYVLADVVNWALARGIALHWNALPAAQLDKAYAASVDRFAPIYLAYVRRAKATAKPAKRPTRRAAAPTPASAPR